ncbi:putative Polycomb group protein ASXL2 isoform X2 [Latimeria chalumnae]|uniref:putative Polycomb group protein ASXL2 isoform X2 n=1 Tax=Latimeria chalumnae TaxID=7897 RepID=UPI00313E4023
MLFITDILGLVLGVLEKYPNTPMSHKEILQVIQREGLKEIRSGTSPLACLNAMLHTNSRGEEGIFYKVPGRMGVYTLKKDVADGVKDLSDGSEENSDAQSDSQSTENNKQDGKKNRWKKKVSSGLPSQPSSPQSSCPSPSIPASKVISPSQKHSKKALKQALKQQQQKKQRRPGMPVPSSQHLLLKTVKAANEPAASKTAWDGKQSEAQSNSPQNSTSSSGSSAKTDPAASEPGKKASQRSDRLNARQLKRTKCAEIDVETPESILVNTNLRALINKHTFSLLSAECQQRLLLLLPEVDRQMGADGTMKLSTSALNNEFFTSAAQGWKERLAEGEFTPEMRLRIRQEIEKEKKVEPWKEQFFENYYGQTSGLSLEESKKLTTITDTGPSKETTKLQPEQQKPLTPAPVVLEPTKPEAGDGVQRKEQTKPKVDIKQAVKALRDDKKELHKKAPEEPVRSSLDKIVEVAAPTASSKAAALPEETGGDPDVVKSKLSADGDECVVEKEPEAKEKQAQPAHAPEDFSPRNPEPVQTKENEAAAEGKAATQEVPEKGHPVSELMMDVGPGGLKRKLGDHGTSPSSPEKRSRVSGGQPPQHQHQLFRTPPKSFPSVKEQVPERKVPPLKIPVSRISPLPASAGQVSPRASFPTPVTSPGRTGARTLADIKAKAQLAKAQRAAAAAAAAAAATAAAAGGSVPGPGPGGGGPEGGGGSSSPANRAGENGRNGSALELVRTGSGGGAGGPLSCKAEAHTRAASKGPTLPSSDDSSRAQLQPTTNVPAKNASKDSTSKAATSPAIAVGLSTGKANTGKPAAPKALVLSAAIRLPPAPSQAQAACSVTTPGDQEKAPARSTKAATQPSGVFNTNDESGYVTGASVTEVTKSVAKTGQLASVEKTMLHAVPSSIVALTISMPNTITMASLPSSSAMPRASQAKVTVTPAVSSLPCSTLPLVSSLKGQRLPFSAGTSIPRTVSNIPANNPLVTQLLQGKEVPLEHILPKPLTKIEMRTLPITSPNEKGKMPSTTRVVVSVAVGSNAGGVGSERQSAATSNQQFANSFSGQRQPLQNQRVLQLVTGREMRGMSFEHSPHMHETLNRTTQQQILQTLIHRVQNQNTVPLSQLAQQGIQNSGFQPKEDSPGQSFILGFMGRKTTSRPAMSGHYLLNISTYGRGSESLRRAQLINAEARLSATSLINTPKNECSDKMHANSDNQVGTDIERIEYKDTVDQDETTFVKTEQEPPYESGKTPDTRKADTTHEHSSTVGIKIESPGRAAAAEKENTPLLPRDQLIDRAAVARDFLQAAQTHVVNVLGGKMTQGNQELYRTSGPPVDYHQQQAISHHLQKSFYGNHAQLISPGYGGTINVSTSPVLNHGSATPGYNRISGSPGNIMSFSVTVTTIPASQAVNPGGHDHPIPVQAFTERGVVEDPPSKCCCRLKAMIMCQGCGAFCHDDCIGPSKLCVSCLVVR